MFSFVLFVLGLAGVGVGCGVACFGSCGSLLEGCFSEVVTWPVCVFIGFGYVLVLVVRTCSADAAPVGKHVVTATYVCGSLLP